MSPNVGNFVHDLVEMAKAMETLPQVQEELDRAKSQIENYAKQVQDRELSIINYKDQIEALNAKVRSLEVERDDASFRVMEAEDLNHVILNLARSASIDLAAMISKLDPPKPEPEKIEEQAVQFPNEGQLGDKFSSDPTVGTGQQETAVHSIPVASQDAGTIGTGTTSVEEAPKSDANPTQTYSGTASDNGHLASKGPYEGNLYHDMPHYIPLDEWVAGGGTESNYFWRPTRTVDVPY